MTPLQKLIKQFEEIKDSNLESSIDVDFAISLTKSLLEEEKEVMCEFADDYQRNCFQKSSDDYYNETFKTKEK